MAAHDGNSTSKAMQECVFGKEEIWLGLGLWAEGNVASGSFEAS
jgi:hypothetical protein